MLLDKNLEFISWKQWQNTPNNQNALQMNEVKF